jgi:hypothetical protein
MSATESYDEIIDFIAAGATPEDVNALVHRTQSRSALPRWSSNPKEAPFSPKSNLNLRAASNSRTL